MAKTNKTVLETEQHEAEELIQDILSPGNMELYQDYFNANLDADGSNFLHNYYDHVVFSVAENEKYYYGTAAARAHDALKVGGHFILNTNGTVLEIDNIIAVTQLFFEYLQDQSRDGYYVFVKVAK